MSDPGILGRLFFVGSSFRSDKGLAKRIKSMMSPDELLYGESTGMPPPKVIVVKPRHLQLSIRESFTLSARPSR